MQCYSDPYGLLEVVIDFFNSTLSLFSQPREANPMGLKPVLCCFAMVFSRGVKSLGVALGGMIEVGPREARNKINCRAKYELLAVRIC